MPFETPGLSYAPTPRHRAPYDILRAQDLVLVHPNLPAKLRLTMQVLVAHANRFTPSKEIMVGVGTIAKAIGRDRKTVTRHLDELETLGWIIRGDQGRVGRRGIFNSGRFAAGCKAVLTEKALLAAELVHKADENKPVDKMSHGYTLTKLTPTKRQPERAIKTGIPSELAWLSKHLSVPGIFALMKKFSANGKRLSDAALVLRSHLNKLGITGGRLFGYLAKLAAGSRCFAMDACRLHEAAKMDEQSRAVQSEADAFRDEIVGKTLVKRGGRVTLFVESRNFVHTVVDGVQGSRPYDDAWLLKLRDQLLAGIFVRQDPYSSIPCH